ncbi:MAG TPA: IS630 family transposase [Isosphaeraceae bacterium]|nr:IS630 family transposase [Isosphaeraceae bacterium]
MEKYRVTLEAEERTALERLISAGKAASRKLAHARILLLADAVHGEGHRDEDIVAALSASPRTIARVRKRFVTEGIEAALDPRPRPARPDKIKIKGDIEQKLIKLACTDPPRGRCHWTLQLLADEMVVLGLVDSISTETVRLALKKNDIQPWIVQSWCIPPKANAEFVWRMEDVIQTYMLPYAPKWPVVCFDEASRQLFGEVRPPESARRGAPARADYEYERKGVCCQLVMCEPLRGWRHVTVTERRTRQDYAHCIRDMVDHHFPGATKIRLVQDNLNTHDGASLYETFPPEEARRILDKIEFHFTPKHGSWLNMAETEINIMNRQCLDRRLDNQGLMAEEVAAWEAERNTRKARIHWTFTLAVARQKLRKLYPSI